MESNLYLSVTTGLSSICGPLTSECQAYALEFGSATLSLYGCYTKDNQKVIADCLSRS